MYLCRALVSRNCQHAVEYIYRVGINLVPYSMLEQAGDKKLVIPLLCLLKNLDGNESLMIFLGQLQFDACGAFHSRVARANLAQSIHSMNRRALSPHENKMSPAWPCSLGQIGLL